MKLISWNVNGLRACLKKGFLESVQSLDADVLCLQETKMQPGQCEIDLPGYEQIYNSAEKRAIPEPPCFPASRFSPALSASAKANTIGKGA